jgi:hypothetical protein
VIRIELYERARQLAGVEAVDVEAATLGEALAAAARAHPALEGPVIHHGRLAPHWRASLDGRAFVEDPATPLPADGTVILISALAGG